MTTDQDPVHLLTYRGPAPFVSLLAQELGAEGSPSPTTRPKRTEASATTSPSLCC